MSVRRGGTRTNSGRDARLECAGSPASRTLKHRHRPSSRDGHKDYRKTLSYTGCDRGKTHSRKKADLDISWKTINARDRLIRSTFWTLDLVEIWLIEISVDLFEFFGCKKRFWISQPSPLKYFDCFSSGKITLVENILSRQIVSVMIGRIQKWRCTQSFFRSSDARVFFLA